MALTSRAEHFRGRPLPDLLRQLSRAAQRTRIARIDESLTPISLAMCLLVAPNSAAVSIDFCSARSNALFLFHAGSTWTSS